MAIGRKGKYQEWLDPDHLTLACGWAQDGLSEKQIAQNIGISESTLREWKKKYPAFSAALKRGKEVVDYAVENALLKKAIGGDTGAICFWLKNRRPDKWRDKPEPKNSTGNDLMQALVDLARKGRPS